MDKKYVLWWHNFVYDISRDATTIEEVYDSVSKTLEDLNKLKSLEKQGKIKVKDTGSLNPLHIEIIDTNIEEELKKNPIIDILD